MAHIKRILHTALALLLLLLLLTAAAGAREITIMPYPGPAFRPGYWLVVKVSLNDAANITHVRLRNAAGGLAVEVPLAEAQSGMPILFHRVPEKVQVTLLDGERQVEQQTVPIKLTPLAENEVSLLVITDSPTWSQQAVAALPKAPRLVARVSPEELSSHRLLPDPYSHLSLDPAVTSRLDEAARKTILRRLALGGVAMLPRSAAPPEELAATVMEEKDAWLWLTIPRVGARPAGDPNVDLELVTAFERPRWPTFLKDWTLIVLAGGALILLVGWLLSWTFQRRWPMPTAAAIALAAMLAGTAIVQQYIRPAVHDRLAILTAHANGQFGQVEFVNIASALQNVQTGSWGDAPVYYRADQADEETLVLRPKGTRGEYQFSLEPRHIKVFRTVRPWPRNEESMHARREGPDSWMATSVLEDGWLVRKDQAVAVHHDAEPRLLVFDGARPLSDVIDELAGSDDYCARMSGRLLRYVRNSRRLDADGTYFVSASWWDSSVERTKLPNVDNWGYLRIIELP